MTTFVDTNVLLDVFTDDPAWADWSKRQLAAAASRGPVLIGDTAYAEVSAGYARMEDVEAALATVAVGVERTPRAALFLAGQAHRRYRRAGGTRTGVLSDFLVGAHAAVAGAPLLTRDRARYRAYFPGLRLLCP